MSWMKRVDCDFAFRSLEDGVNDYVRNYLLKDEAHLES